MHHKGCQCALTEDNKCYNKQTRFLRTLKTRPRYAKYVKTFKWTLVYHEDQYSYADFPVLPSYSKDELSGIWAIFRMFTEVMSVEIAEWDSCGEIAEWVPENLTLFPKAISIKLSGVLTDTVIQSVLPANRISKLQHLHLEDVQSHAHGCTFTEATIQFLNGLIGKCTALKSLTVIDSEVFLDDPTADHPTGFTALARLLESVKATLENFHFECHGLRHEVTYGSLYDPQLYPQLYRASIERILSHGNWPRLRKVIILPPKGLQIKKRTEYQVT